METEKYIIQSFIQFGIIIYILVDLRCRVVRLENEKFKGGLNNANK